MENLLDLRVNYLTQQLSVVLQGHGEPQRPHLVRGTVDVILLVFCLTFTEEWFSDCFTSASPSICHCSVLCKTTAAPAQTHSYSQHNGTYWFYSNVTPGIQSDQSLHSLHRGVCDVWRIHPFVRPNDDYVMLMISISSLSKWHFIRHQRATPSSTRSTPQIYK